MRVSCRSIDTTPPPTPPRQFRWTLLLDSKYILLSRYPFRSLDIASLTIFCPLVDGDFDGGRPSGSIPVAAPGRHYANDYCSITHNSIEYFFFLLATGGSSKHIYT